MYLSKKASIILITCLVVCCLIGAIISRYISIECKVCRDKDSAKKENYPYFKSCWLKKIFLFGLNGAVSKWVFAINIVDFVLALTLCALCVVAVILNFAILEWFWKLNFCCWLVLWVVMFIFFDVEL